MYLFVRIMMAMMGGVELNDKRRKQFGNRDQAQSVPGKHNGESSLGRKPQGRGLDCPARSKVGMR